MIDAMRAMEPDCSVATSEGSIAGTEREAFLARRGRQKTQLMRRKSTRAAGHDISVYCIHVL